MPCFRFVYSKISSTYVIIILAFVTITIKRIIKARTIMLANQSACIKNLLVQITLKLIIILKLIILTEETWCKEITYVRWYMTDFI